jgi:putative FmdB family regulatory protein
LALESTECQHLEESRVPTYAYRCVDCGHAFDVQQSFTDESLTVCPVCDGTVRKVFSSVGVVFKGSGFYRNDSRKGASKSGSAPAAKESKETKKDAGESAGATPSTSESSSAGNAPASAPSTSGSSTTGSSSGASGSTTSAKAASD